MEVQTLPALAARGLLPPVGEEKPPGASPGPGARAVSAEPAADEAWPCSEPFLSNRRSCSSLRGFWCWFLEGGGLAECCESSSPFSFGHQLPGAACLQPLGCFIPRPTQNQCGALTELVASSMATDVFHATVPDLGRAGKETSSLIGKCISFLV